MQIYLGGKTEASNMCEKHSGTSIFKVLNDCICDACIYYSLHVFPQLNNKSTTDNMGTFAATAPD